MIIKGLDGKEHKWKFSTANTSKRSKLHNEVRDILKELYPYDPVLEEVTLPGTKRPGRSTLLFADFYLPNRNLIIEVHGEQHYKYNSHFFKDKHSFYKSKLRDNDKKEWCRINNIDIIELPYNDRESWKRRITRR